MFPHCPRHRRLVKVAQYRIPRRRTIPPLVLSLSSEDGIVPSGDIIPAQVRAITEVGVARGHRYGLLGRCAHRGGEAHKQAIAFAIRHRPGPEGGTKEVNLRISIGAFPCFLGTTESSDSRYPFRQAPFSSPDPTTDRDQQEALTLQYGEDMGVMCLLYARVALQVLGYPDQALATARRTGERSHEAELYRLKGEFMLEPLESGAPSPEAEAKACFVRTLDIARSQGTRLFELRAAVSLGRLRMRQGKR
jgi:hypothetical protein